MVASLLVVSLLSQADLQAEKSAAERAAVAAEKAAESAAKAAEAAQRIADRIAPPAPPAPAAAAPAPSAGAWAGTASLGLSLLGGNAETITLTGSVGLDKKWELWTLGIRATGAYGVTNPNTTTDGSLSESQTVARRAGATVRGDRSFGVFVLGGFEFDHIKSIESRGYGEAGASFTLFNEKVEDLEKLFVRFDVALRGGRESRWIYFPRSAPPVTYIVPLLSPRVAGTIRWALNKNFRLSEDFEVLPSMLAPTAGRFLINSNTKVNARITENVSLTLGFLINIDTQPPAANLRPFDYALTAGAEAAF
jgi:hypothetical protein